MIPILRTTETLAKWIASCYTYEQLATCEKAIQSLLVDRYPVNDLTKNTDELTAAMQWKRLQLQIFSAL